MNKHTAIRLATADTLGHTCAIAMIAACPLDAKDADGAYLTQAADPLPGDWEALEGKLLDPTDEEREAFRAAYRTAIEAAIKESGRDSTTTYTLRDDGGSTETIEADDLDDAREQAIEWAEGGEWNLDEGPAHIDVRIELDGETVDCVTVHLEQTPPPCGTRGSKRAHEWVPQQSGCAENPGVHGHGGGVRIYEVCSHCGQEKVTDTAATDHCGRTCREVTYPRAD